MLKRFEVENDAVRISAVELPGGIITMRIVDLSGTRPDFVEETSSEWAFTKAMGLFLEKMATDDHEIKLP